MYRLVLARHGQSQWNLENRFTGWVDVDITEEGRAEALKGAKAIKKEGLSFDVAYTSVLKRAIRTLWIILDEVDQMWIPVNRDWRLNERHYGALQGLNKTETVEKHGAEQVQLWRRSYDTPPPAMSMDDPGHPSKDPRYKHVDPKLLPSCEALKDTKERFLPLWNDEIVPQIKEGKNVLIVAHGNSLRALIQHLEDMTPEEIMKLNVPTGIPLLYELDENLKVTGKRYLGDEEEVRAAIEGVANQTKK